jgi:quercetin dioxygenase-like cupin family protein
MDKEKLRKQLLAEGFPFVHEWIDPPATEYPLHQHQDKVTFFVVKGSVTIDFGGEKRVLHTGDRIDVPPHTDHSAVVGSEGMEIVYGEMIEGDA